MPAGVVPLFELCSLVCAGEMVTILSHPDWESVCGRKWMSNKLLAILGALCPSPLLAAPLWH